MDFQATLIPVLAGYWVLTQTFVFKCGYEQKNYYRIFLESAILGGMMLAVAWSLNRLGLALSSRDMLGTADWLRYSQDVWHILAPFEFSSTIALLVIVALVTPRIINWRISDEEASNRWALDDETARDKLLREALEGLKLVEISLANGRSFVGFVSADPRRLEDLERDVAILPKLSGYRDQETHRLVITTDHLDEDDNFQVALKLEEMTSISHFNIDSPYVQWEVTRLHR